MLREDNADLRLTQKGYEIGLVDAARKQQLGKKQSLLEQLKTNLRSMPVQSEAVQCLIAKANLKGEKARTALDLLSLTQLPFDVLENWMSSCSFYDPEKREILKALHAQNLYAGYLPRIEEEIARLERYASLSIDPGFDYEKVKGLSHELIGKLKKLQPLTIAQASRIQGMTPAGLHLLLAYLQKKTTKTEGQRVTETAD